MIPLVLKKDQHDSDKTQYHKRKQISRILKHLKVQLTSHLEKKLQEQSQEKQQSHPKKILLPSDTLIDRWVHSSLRNEHIEGNDWQKIIYNTLRAIHSQQQLSTLELDESISNSQVEHFLLQLLLLTDRKEMYFR